MPEQELTKGQEVRLKGERGKFTYVSMGYDDTVAVLWDGNKLRYVDPERVTVRKK